MAAIFLRANRNNLKYNLLISGIVNNHTHKLGMTIKYGQYIIENGCSCKRMDYLDEGKKRLESHTGYAVLQLDRKGNLVWNESAIKHIKIKANQELSFLG